MPFEITKVKGEKDVGMYHDREVIQIQKSAFAMCM